MTNTSTLTVEIEGRRFELTADEWQNLDAIGISPDTFHLIDDGQAHTIRLISADPATRRYTFNINGEIKEVSLVTSLDLLIEKMGLNASHAKKQSVLKAPMPGLVTGIKVVAGQEVEKGAPLIVLEAMKMENLIVAPHHAIIRDIKVSVSQAVDKGAILVAFAD